MSDCCCIPKFKLRRRMSKKKTIRKLETVQSKKFCDCNCKKCINGCKNPYNLNQIIHEKYPPQKCCSEASFINFSSPCSLSNSTFESISSKDCLIMEQGTEL